MLFRSRKNKMDNNFVLSFNSHGKANVRLVKVVRKPEQHLLKELTLELLLEGEFETSYTKADNSSVVPTDTCKNILYLKAFDEDFDDIETFGIKVTEFVLNKYKHVSAVSCYIIEHLWERLVIKGKPHPHSFQRATPAVRIARVRASKSGPTTVQSGIDELLVLKTTQSGFVNFHKCEYTTLPEDDDRILSTIVNATWNYDTSAKNINFNQIWDGIKTIILEEFAEKYSISVQDTMYRAQKLILEKFPQISNIKLVLPNKHHWTVDLEKFGRKNRFVIFNPVSAPNGKITCELTRKTQSKL